jgi:periplasmic copper chaperone A
MKSKYVGITLVFAVSFLMPLTALSCKTADVNVSNVTILAGPPGQANAAGYATFKNNGMDNCELVGASTPVAERMELHTVTENNGMMKMQQVQEFMIPANGELLLAPGGNHLMLMQLKQTLAPNEEVPITLMFKDGQEMKVNAKVQDMRTAPNMGHAGH